VPEWVQKYDGMCYSAFMRKRDGRKLGHKTLEEIRIRAVERVAAGESPEDVINTWGFHRSCIYDWLAKYREGGIDALRAKRISGRPPKLKGSQLKKLYDIITLKTPLQLRFEFALWTRAMIRELIREEFGVRLSEVSVGRLLRKLGLSPQRPLRRAYQQDKERVECWLTEEYPAIRGMARREGATIYFGDEAGVRSDYHSGTTWAPVGQTPVVECTGARFSLNLISAISPKGELRFMTVKGTVNGSKFVEFLKRLIHNATRPIYLIVDGHPAHRAKVVKEYLLSTDGRVRLFFLPPYSPELNPDELVWNHIKNHKLGRTAVKGPDDLKEKVTSFLRSLQRMPEKIRGFFREPNVRYAAF
jgi:transposase